MSNGSSPSDIIGKKVFFLHPTAVIQNKIIDELVQMEYEVYTAKDQMALGRILKKYPDSIVFVDIHETLSAEEWERWIRGVLGSQDTRDVVVGIVTSRENADLRQKYAGIGAKGGYTLLKSDLNAAIKQIIVILNAMEAKGRRKYLRATMENEANTTINLSVNSSFVKGFIKDISVVGISCTFDIDPELQKNTLFKGIQLKLQSVLINVEGIVFGSRMDGSDKIYVILFTQRIDPVVRTKIRKYIQQNSQTKMDVELR